jgi:DNA-binding transcriptional ArsR family regulator
MDASLKALAEPRRREILRLLWDRELPAGRIAERFAGVSRAAISQHIKVLREAGLLYESRNGRRRLYRARREGVEELREQLVTFWEGRLDEIKSRAEAEERRVRDADRDHGR